MSAIEITAHDIETAIKIGLAQMNLLRAEVKIEVVDEGSKGVLGIGARHARVRLTPYVEPTAQPPVDTATVTEASPEEPEITEQDEPEAEEMADDGAPQEDEEEVDAEPDMADDGVEMAATLTQGVLDRMDYQCTCAGRLVPAADSKEHDTIWVDIQGKDASHLLSHQCEALDALQLVVQTMWAHQTKSNLRVTLDADSYKEHREKRLRQMALRIAENVANGGRAITLEPMPASERRLVHIALRDHPSVVTESHGEGIGRRITVKPK